MSAGMIGLVAGGVLAVHGIGHVLGWMPAFGLASFEGVSSRSWALTGVLGEGGARMAGGILFVVPMVGFLVAAGGLLAGQPWWRQAAVGSASISLLATALYPQAFTTASTVGSVAVNVAVLYGILIAGWGASSVSA